MIYETVAEGTVVIVTNKATPGLPISIFWPGDEYVEPRKGEVEIVTLQDLLMRIKEHDPDRLRDLIEAVAKR